LDPPHSHRPHGAAPGKEKKLATLDDLFIWVDKGDPTAPHVLTSAVAVVRDRSNPSPYRLAGGPAVRDYAAAGEVVFHLDPRTDGLRGAGNFAFTDRQAGDRVGQKDLIEFRIERNGSATMKLLTWGGEVRELVDVVIEDGPLEGTFLRGYFDRGISGAGLVTMSFDRAIAPYIR
jgi:hypothetical protein